MFSSHLTDTLNGFFEAIGGVLVWLNVIRLWKDRQVRGIDWRVMFFFTAWGWWNLYYYPSLHQPISTVGAMVMAAANSTWVIMALKFRHN